MFQDPYFKITQRKTAKHLLILELFQRAKEREKKIPMDFFMKIHNRLYATLSISFSCTPTHQAPSYSRIISEGKREKKIPMDFL